jgi:hypothetical protein
MAHADTAATDTKAFLQGSRGSDRESVGNLGNSGSGAAGRQPTSRCCSAHPNPPDHVAARDRRRRDDPAGAERALTFGPQIRLGQPGMQCARRAGSADGPLTAPLQSSLSGVSECPSRSCPIQNRFRPARTSESGYPTDIRTSVFARESCPFRVKGMNTTNCYAAPVRPYVYQPAIDRRKKIDRGATLLVSRGRGQVDRD